MTDRELMQQALCALEQVAEYFDVDSTETKTIIALRERLAQPDPVPYWHSEFLKHNTTSEQPAQQPTNCRHCGGAADVICAGQCKDQPALEHEPENEPWCSMHSKPATPEMNAAVDVALGIVRKQPAQQQEPVAWMDGYRNIYSLEEKAAGCEDAVIPLVPATLQHWSDCAVHNEPAYQSGKCDCGGYTSPQPAQQKIGVCGEKRGACGLPCEPCEGKTDPDYVQQPAQQHPDLSHLRPETQEAIRGWIKDGTFFDRAIGAMHDQEKRLMAYEKAQQQEPIGEVFINTGSGALFAPMKDVRWKDGKMPPEGTKLYDRPPAKPLTDEQIEKKFEEFAAQYDTLGDEWQDMGANDYFKAGFKAAHSIKE